MDTGADEQTISQVVDFRGCSLVKTIVNGKWGTVLAVKKNDADNESNIIKLIKKSKFYKDEIEVHRELGIHENIIKLLDFFEVKSGSNGRSYVGIQMERMETDLRKVIRSTDVPFRRSQMKAYFRQMVSGVEHMHSMLIAHLDLKPLNMFVTGDRLKIGDFGLSLSVDAEGGRKGCVYNGTGTHPFRSPQAMLKKNETRKAIKAFPCDVFALGISLICMFSKNDPWRCSDESDKKYMRWRENKLDSRSYIKYNEMSDNLMDLLRQMLQHDDGKRCTLEEVKQHPWFTDDTAEMEPKVPKPRKLKRKYNQRRVVAPSNPPTANTNEENVTPPVGSGVQNNDVGKDAPGPANVLPPTLQGSSAPEKRAKRKIEPAEESEESMAQRVHQEPFGKRVPKPKRKFALLM